MRSWGRAGDALVRQDLAWAFSHVEIMRHQGLRLLAAIVDDKDPGPFASLNKMFSRSPSAGSASSP